MELSFLYEYGSLHVKSGIVNYVTDGAALDSFLLSITTDFQSTIYIAHMSLEVLDLVSKF